MPRTSDELHCNCDEPAVSRAGTWARAGGMLILTVGAYLLIKRFGIFSFATQTEGVAGLGAIFVIGLVAATSSCLAVVGGLLLSVSAKWCEAYKPATHWQKLRPLLLFNAGRLAGYFVLGGLVGLLGKSLSLTPYSTGIFTVVIACAMIVMGLNILHILPKEYCRLPLPRGLQKKIHGLSSSQSFAAPMLLGAITFFLPCGFTQSMQLLALSSGSFLMGGAIMLTFALGTLPSLLGISFLSALLEGRAARFFISFSGAVVLLLGLFNLQSGLLLMGYDPVHALFAQRTTQIPSQSDPYVSIDARGRQIMSMYVNDNGYSPNNFTILPGKETWVYAIAEHPISGCATFLVDATHNLQTPINVGGNWLGPIKNPRNDFVITCSMGMLKANIHVKNT